MKIKTQTETEDYEEILDRYVDAKAAVEDAQEYLAKCQAKLTGYLESHRLKSKSFRRDGYIFRATFKQNTSVQIDEAGLRKKMGAAKFDRYTVKKLDRKALEEAIESGEVDRVLVAPFVTTKESNPFIQYTMREERDEAPDQEHG